MGDNLILENSEKDKVEILTIKEITLNGINYKPKITSLGLDVPIVYFDSTGNKVSYLRIPMDLIKNTLKLALERTNVEWS